MKAIELTRGMYAKVDDDDFEPLSKINWYYAKVGYACNRRVGYMHRIVTKAPKGVFVDHINGDKLDNRRSNLRFCNRSQNAANSIKAWGNTSKYRGVAWKKDKKKWKAYITYSGKQIHIGYFDDEELATEARDNKARQLHQEFFRSNKLNNK